MAGETDLRVLLADLRPVARPGRFVVVSLPAVPAGLVPAATIVEDEGVTVVVGADEAAAHGLAADVEFGWITLSVHSSLVAVGLTATVASALAAAGISANMLAGYHHDHLLVPVGDVDAALGALAELRT